MDLTTKEMVFDRSQGKFRSVAPEGVRLLSSASLGWKGCLLEHVHTPPMESKDVQWIKNVVVLHLGQPTTFERKEGGKFVTQRVEPGQISIFPANCVTSARLSEPMEYLSLSLSPAFITAARGNADSAPQSDLENRYGVNDKFVEGVCLALRDETQRGGDSGMLYSEALATGLAVHLLRRYGLGRRGANSECGKVPNYRIRQAITFINDRLGQDISLNDIAASVNLSAFHFARVFKQSVGIPPHQFVIQQRLEKAKTLLMRSDTPISEVALELGFADQSHFTSQFRRRCGMTPQQFINLSGGRRAV